MNSKIAVVAVGGNALITNKNNKTVLDQFDAAKETMGHISSMIEQGWNVVLTHGNGPQVGFILRRSELSLHELHPVPLDYCVADTQGAIGYMFQKSLTNHFKEKRMDKHAVTVVTQVEVSRDDPALENPTKPIGSFLDEETAKQRMADGKVFVEDAGRGWRQVVPSPKPLRIVEIESIKQLVESGFVVIAAGGGGIPVIEKESNKKLKGIEAVIDKDFASSLLANNLNADLLLISTAVEKVAINFNKPDEKWLDKMTVAEAKQYIEEGHFAPGSMLPKVKACIQFIKNGGSQALITDPPNIPRALAGETGTWIVP
ncbi:MAG: carbamate kinase [Chloroflexi bacterium]|jgi:carbamate kinase|nr:carbamate kinase [Chloroflexota bacterium]MBT3670666.1 carbamate kinase [Chloroflexota bacterium]MBT4002675.1 carbamate kinase [Chloroflexota bacterium]MBT4306298.1 carbamate kinase [Chloroflexota bacterium]MBT4532821.1 carbamate kinase [Chloroflexota bacterium]